MVRTLWQRLVHATTNTRPRRFPTHRLSLEILEDRLVPSTFLVTNNSDNLQPGSLRYALTQANSSGNSSSTVEITPQVTGPIVLSLGELPINASMTISNDSGSALEIRQGSANARVFQIGSNAGAVTFTGSSGKAITLDGGAVAGGNGGGILVDSASTTLTLNFVNIVSNRASGDGGGIYSAGSVFLNDSLIAGNTAGSNGGGIYLSNGNVSLNASSSVNGNQAPNGKGGGINVAMGSVIVSGGSHVDGNTARNVGGIEVGNVPQPTATAVSVSGGSTVNGNSSTATVNPVTGDFGGGGIAVEAFGNVYVSASQVSNNRTVGMYSGGIVVALGNVTVTNGSQIDGNTNNGPGGGIAANFLGVVTVSNGSQVDGNTGGALGGGIVNFAGPLGGVVVTGGSQVDGNVLTNGESIGQALGVFLVYANVEMANGQFSQALSGPDGGALLAALPQILTNTVIYNNLASNLSVLPGVFTGGGGIGTLLAPISISSGSEVNDNFVGKRVSNGAAFSVGLGGGIYSAFGPISVSYSTVEGNQAPYGVGGGIFDLAGPVLLDHAVVNDNASLYGGGIWSGGGLFANSSTLADDSAALFGGGEFNLGLVVFLNSTIRNNKAPIGGGINNQGNLVIVGSSVVNNTALLTGGGIANHDGQLVPINSTIAGNEPNDIIWY